MGAAQKNSHQLAEKVYNGKTSPQFRSKERGSSKRKVKSISEIKYHQQQRTVLNMTSDQITLKNLSQNSIFGEQNTNNGVAKYLPQQTLNPQASQHVGSPLYDAGNVIGSAETFS